MTPRTEAGKALLIPNRHLPPCPTSTTLDINRCNCVALVLAIENEAAAGYELVEPWRKFTESVATWIETDFMDGGGTEIVDDPLAAELYETARALLAEKGGTE